MSPSGDSNPRTPSGAYNEQRARHLEGQIKANLLHIQPEDLILTNMSQKFVKYHEGIAKKREKARPTHKVFSYVFQETDDDRKVFFFFSCGLALIFSLKTPLQIFPFYSFFFCFFLWFISCDSGRRFRFEVCHRSQWRRLTRGRGHVLEAIVKFS